MQPKLSPAAGAAGKTRDRRDRDVRWLRLAGGLALAGLLSATAAMATSDHGQRRDDDLRGQASREFGVGEPLAASSSRQITAAEAQADPRRLVTLASGLRARVVSSGAAAPNVDMIALWP